MAYKMLDLVNDAYRRSGVTGNGMPMTANQLDEGIAELNTILDHIYTLNAVNTTIAYNVTFDGSSDYTIGVAPADPLETQPDIALPIMPMTIDQIVLKSSGTREIVYPIDPITYTSRTLDSLTTSSPCLFYFERTFPFGTIRFYEGTPSGQGELVFKAALVDVTSNTDYVNFPRELKPYLIYELAYKLADSNGFETQSLKVQSNNYFNAYMASTYKGQSYCGDVSANGGKYDIYAGD